MLDDEDDTRELGKKKAHRETLKRLLFRTSETSKNSYIKNRHSHHLFKI